MEIANIILEYIKVLIWPLTTTIILFFFRRQVGELFKRAKKIELPGGFSLESFEEKLDEAKEYAKEREDEKMVESNEKHKLKNLVLPPENFSNTVANARMVELGLRPSPSGLDLSYYKGIAERDVTLALAGLRIDFEIMLKNLAKGSGVDLTPRESNIAIMRKLFDENKITSRQYELMKRVFNIANLAIHTADISYGQAMEIFEVAQVLVDDYINWLYWNFPEKK